MTIKPQSILNFNELPGITRWISACLAVLFSTQIKIVKHLLVGAEHSRLTVDDLKPLAEGQRAAERQFKMIACKHNEDLNLLVVKDGMVTCKAGCGLKEKVSDDDAELIKMAQGEAD